jgi:hypothetical protein
MNPVEHALKKNELRIELVKNFDGIINQARNDNSTKNLPIGAMVEIYTNLLKDKYRNSDLLTMYQITEPQLMELIEQAAEITIKRFSI